MLSRPQTGDTSSPDHVDFLIDPTNMTPQEKQFLTKLCARVQDQAALKPNKRYDVRDASGKKCQVMLTHHLIPHRDQFGDLEFAVCKEFVLNEEGIKVYELLGKIEMNDRDQTIEFVPPVRKITMSDVSINPMALTPLQAKFVGTFLTHAYHIKQAYHLGTGTNYVSYTDPVSKAYHQVHFTSKFPLLLRPSEHRIGELRVEVLTDELGKGSFGVVYRATTLSFTPEQQLFVKRQDRVVKFSQKNLDEAHQEHLKSSHVRNRGSKMPLTHGIAQKRYFSRVEHLLPGSELQKLFEAIRAGKAVLTTDQRLWLMKQGIEQMMVLHRAKIVHRDLKPENVIVDLTHQPRPSWQFIDFGLAKWSHEDDSLDDGVGSPIYISPEVFDSRGTTVNSDIYALGIIFGLLWNADENPYLNDKTLTYKQAVKLVGEFAHRYQFTNLFSCQHDLSTEHKNKLEQIIKSMVQATPTNRIKMREAFLIVCDILMQREMAADKLQAEKVTHCFTFLKQLTSYLDELSEQTIYKTQPFFKTIQAQLRKMISESLINDEHVRYFVSIQNLHVFEKCQTVAQMLVVTDAIFANFTAQQARVGEIAGKIVKYEQWLRLNPVDEASGKLAEELLIQVNQLIKLSNERNFTLDNIAEFARKAQKRIPLIQSKFEELQTQVTSAMEQRKRVLSDSSSISFSSSSEQSDSEASQAVSRSFSPSQ